MERASQQFWDEDEQGADPGVSMDESALLERTAALIWAVVSKARERSGTRYWLQ